MGMGGYQICGLANLIPKEAHNTFTSAFSRRMTLLKEVHYLAMKFTKNVKKEVEAVTVKPNFTSKKFLSKLKIASRNFYAD